MRILSRSRAEGGALVDESHGGTTIARAGPAPNRELSLTSVMDQHRLSGVDVVVCRAGFAGAFLRERNAGAAAGSQVEARPGLS